MTEYVHVIAHVDFGCWRSLVVCELLVAGLGIGDQLFELSMNLF